MIIHLPVFQLPVRFDEFPGKELYSTEESMLRRKALLERCHPTCTTTPLVCYAPDVLHLPSTTRGDAWSLCLRCWCRATSGLSVPPAVRHRFINSVLKRDVLEPEAALLKFLGLPAQLHLLEDR